MLVVLTGGTGGAKLIEGLAAEIDPAELTIVCNTGDDTIFHGLHVVAGYRHDYLHACGFSRYSKRLGHQG